MADPDLTPAQKRAAFAAADAYLEEIAMMADVPDAMRSTGKPNPLLRIAYADGYLAGRAVEHERVSRLRVAAKVMLKAFERGAFHPATVQRLMPGILSLRAAMWDAYDDHERAPDRREVKP